MIVLVTGWTRICAESGTCLMQTTRCMVSLQAPITCVPAFPLLASVSSNRNGPHCLARYCVFLPLPRGMIVQKSCQVADVTEIMLIAFFQIVRAGNWPHA
ncbi:hypothetical protein CN210_29440 [Sinorhizobium meliloti]|nr:hypothetical protein CN233_24040 [Sinorhizobium meliloti]RVG99628.1 hypothetical protein CN210_29440 [Sinorhizobium meliloti]RVK92562.1 hypothetical protein CN152_24685 [Sinorhizobium meliloti]RVN41064.1 hypothetical protein CN113_25650 [Sinorhizobium meliloti]